MYNTLIPDVGCQKIIKSNENLEYYNDYEYDLRDFGLSFKKDALKLKAHWGTSVVCFFYKAQHAIHTAMCIAYFFF